MTSPHEAASSEILQIDNTTNPKMSGTDTKHISDSVPARPVCDSARNKLARWADDLLVPRRMSETELVFAHAINVFHHLHILGIG